MKIIIFKKKNNKIIINYQGKSIQIELNKQHKHVFFFIYDKQKKNNLTKINVNEILTINQIYYVCEHYQKQNMNINTRKYILAMKNVNQKSKSKIKLEMETAKRTITHN